MRRNWDLIRAILLAAEEDGSAASARPMRRPVHGETAFHVRMMEKAGLVALDVQHTINLTWTGRDLLDAIRNERVWDCCRCAIELNAGGMPTDLLLAIAGKAIDLVAHDVLSPRA